MFIFTTSELKKKKRERERAKLGNKMSDSLFLPNSKPR